MTRPIPFRLDQNQITPRQQVGSLHSHRGDTAWEDILGLATSYHSWPAEGKDNDVIRDRI